MKPFNGTLSFFMAAVICTVLLSGCAPSKARESILSQEWSYASAQQDDTWQTAYAKKYTPLSGRIDHNDIAALIPGRNGFLWLRKDFTIPDQLKEKELSLILGRIMIADETWLNGEIIGRTGKFPPVFFSGWNTLRNYHLHKSLLKKDTNTLLVKIYCNAEGAVTGDISLGDEQDHAAAAEIDAFFNTFINLIASFIMLVFGFYHLIIFYKRRKDRENLYFALICFCSSLYQTNFFITWIPGFADLNIPYLWFQKSIFATLTLIYLFTSYFLRNFLGFRGKSFTRPAFLALTAIAISALVLSPDYSSFIAVRNITQLLFIPYSLYIIVLLALSIMNKNKEARFILIAGIIMCTLIGYDIIFHIYFRIYSGIYLGGLGFIVFLLALAAILARRFASYRNEIEELNISLEHKVEQRTSELMLLNKELNTTNHILKDTQKKIIAIASTDPLTGLKNRQELARKLSEEQTRLDRTKNGSDTAILFIDLDNFKYINDTFGHAAGDKVLSRFADILTKSSRAVDFIARFGGDEFVIIMFAQKSEGTAILAQRILDDMTQNDSVISGLHGLKGAPDIPADKRLSCSIGIAHWKPGMTLDQMMNAADKALYTAKNAGKNRFASL